MSTCTDDDGWVGRRGATWVSVRERLRVCTGVWSLCPVVCRCVDGGTEAKAKQGVRRAAWTMAWTRTAPAFSDARELLYEGEDATADLSF